MDDDLPGFKLDFHAFPGEFIESPALPLECAKHWRNLGDLTSEIPQRRFDTLACDLGGHLAQR